MKKRKPKPLTELGKRIEKAAARLKLSLSSVAGLLGVSYSGLWRWMTSEREARMSELQREIWARLEGSAATIESDAASEVARHLSVSGRLQYLEMLHEVVS